MTLFAVVSFLVHPIRFVKDWRRSHCLFDKAGYLRDGSDGIR